MKNKKKLKKIILILFILIAILILAIILIINNNDETEENASELSISNINSEKVIPISSESFFQNYYGNVSEDDVYMTLTNIAYYIIDNKQEINEWLDDDIENAYLINEQYFKTIGLVEKENFYNIINLAKGIDSDELSLSYTAFEIDTISYLSNSISVDVTIKYVDVEEISLLLILDNEEESENPIEIDAN